MTTQTWRVPEKDVECELDKLTYSAYLLTLDPVLALSVVTAALDDAVANQSGENDLLVRTVELALKEVQAKPGGGWDRESTASEVVLYGDYRSANSGRVLSLKQENASNPILSLQFAARIAFVLHHVLGYNVRNAAEMRHIHEKQFRRDLYHAYTQLAVVPGSQVFLGTGEPGQA